MTEPKQLAPAGLSKTGRDLWRRLTKHLEFDAQEVLVLGEACRIADRLDSLDAVIRRDGPTLPDGRPLPALMEARQQAITLSRLIASLRLPEDLSDPKRRPQQRGGSRGIYRLFQHEREVS
jgi:hypothetical protein